MVNRTLRRSYSGTDSDANSFSATTGSESGSESERITGIENTDRDANIDGEHDEPNTNGSGSIGFVEIEPGELGAYITGDGNSNGDGDGTRKRRGRKPGSRNKAGSKKAAETVEPFLMMAHQWASVFLKTPELELSEDEAKKLSDAYSNFCAHHDVPVLSDKRLSEINMIAALGMVYGPRLIAVRNRKKEESAAKKAKNVTPFSQVTQ